MEASLWYMAFQDRSKLPLGRGLISRDEKVELFGSVQGRSAALLLHFRAGLWNRCNVKLKMRFMR
jgi:hypothetical protein